MNEVSAISTLWVLVGAALVFFMQAGFAMVETGFTRAKNAGNIIMKNLMDFCIGTPCFWLLGFGLMFGGSGALIGSVKGIASEGIYGTGMLPEGVPFFAYLIFQTVFCATAATIVSGAMAERTKFISYCIYSTLISLIVYPISGHWIWGGGWLAQLGFHDFAGSTAVHMVGGVAAFVGACILGPRIGKYTKDGKVHAIPGHNLTLGALGVFILWFCWFGFNGGSTVSMEGEAVVAAGKIFVTTNLAAATASIAVMLVTWIQYKKPDVSMTLNGSLAGLVAITAGCDTVSPLSAAIIGVLAGLLVNYGITFIDQKLKIDDPVGAVGVHALNGAMGTLAVGIFSDGTGTFAPGLLFGGGASLLWVQLLGVAAVIAWTAVTMLIIFTAIKKTVGLRVSREEELAGLDKEEHGLSSSYADFMTLENGAAAGSTALSAVGGNRALGAEAGAGALTLGADVLGTQTKEDVTGAAAYDTGSSITVGTIPAVVSPDGKPLHMMTIITRQNKLHPLLQALNEIGVMGVTITNVLGCGTQKGATQFYRGVEVDLNLLPKVKLEIALCEVPVALVVETARRVLYTGNIGDGKIFVHGLEDAVKIRTGESGWAALQDSEV